MSHKPHSLLLAAFSIVAISSLLAGCSKNARVSAEAGTGIVTESTLTDTVDSSGSVQADQVAILTWDTSGVVSVVNVQTGDFVKTGDVLVELDSTTVPAEVIQGYVDLAEAKLALEDAKSNSSTAKAAVALAEAKAAYEEALGHYYQIGVSYGDQSDIAEIEAALNIAEIQLKQANERLTDLSSLADDNLQKAQAVQNVLNCQENVNELKTTLNYYKSTPDALDEETLKANLELAKAELDSAQREYDRVKDGPNADDIAVAQAAVDAAQATVNKMKIIAPFDGEVIVIYNQVGDQVSQGESSVILVNRDKMYVEVSIDETSISNIKVGDVATISFDAFPGKETTGKVTFINPIGSSVSGVVNYTVRVELDKADPSILIGATASITIQTGDPESILFVPIEAVQSDAQGEYVTRITNNGEERVSVVSGQIVNDTVVVDGDLKAGDIVKLYTSTSSSSEDTTETQSSRDNFIPGGNFNGGNMDGGNPPSGGGMMP